MDVPDERKVKFSLYKLSRYALSWWEQIQRKDCHWSINLREVVLVFRDLHHQHKNKTLIPIDGLTLKESHKKQNTNNLWIHEGFLKYKSRILESTKEKIRKPLWKFIDKILNWKFFYKFGGQFKSSIKLDWEVRIF